MIGGLCNKKFMAPFMLEGHCNTIVFELYIEKILAPELQPGMVVVIDNASFHKSLKVKNLIEGAGAKLIYLPPYSPALNPIEHYWHKIKTSIRKIMRGAKILLDEAMGNVLKELSTC
jgi:transposase